MPAVLLSRIFSTFEAFLNIVITLRKQKLNKNELGNRKRSLIKDKKMRQNGDEMRRALVLKDLSSNPSAAPFSFMILGESGTLKTLSSAGKCRIALDHRLIYANSYYLKALSPEVSIPRPVWSVISTE